MFSYVKLHWGGSEHYLDTVNNTMMEIQLFLYNKDLYDSFQEALLYNDGVLGVAFLVTERDSYEISRCIVYHLHPTKLKKYVSHNYSENGKVFLVVGLRWHVTCDVETHIVNIPTHKLSSRTEKLPVNVNLIRQPPATAHFCWHGRLAFYVYVYGQHF